MVSLVGVVTGVTSARVGDVLSTVTDEALVVAVTSVPAFPAESEKLMVKVTAPSVSPDCTVYEDVQLLPDVLTVVIEPRTDTLPDLNVTVGVPIVSDDVYERVTVLPVTAKAGLALLDAIETEVKVGAVVSIVNDETESKLLKFPTESVTLTVQFECVPAERALNVTVLLPETAEVDGEEQSPP